MLASGAKCFERRRHVAFVVTESGCEMVLIVTFDDGVVFDEQFAQTKSGGAFTVSKMMDDLTRAPLAGNRMGREALGWKTVQRLHHLFIAGGVLGNESVSFFRVTNVNSPFRVIGEAAYQIQGCPGQARRFHEWEVWTCTAGQFSCSICG